MGFIQTLISAAIGCRTQQKRIANYRGLGRANYTDILDQMPQVSSGPTTYAESMNNSGGCCDPCEIDINRIPADSVYTVAQVIQPVTIGQVVTVFVVPNTQHFLLTDAFMSTNDGAPCPIGSGMDFVPAGYPQSKQFIGGGAAQSHIEGIYILQSAIENSAWGNQQVSIYRGSPKLIPAGSTIRIVRGSDAVNTTMTGKVAGYLINANCQKIKAKPGPVGLKLPAHNPGGYEGKTY